MLNYKPNSTEGVYTLSEFVEECNRPPVFEGNAEHLKNHKGRDNLDWMGIKDEVKPNETSHECTTRLIRDGWHKGVELMAEVEKSLSLPVPKAIRRVQRWMNAGDDIDMQKVWNGDIDTAWRGTHRDFRSGPQRVRLLIDCIDSGGADEKTMRWRGVAALKLADALTEAGYSVQVESVMSTKDWSKDNHKFICRVVVKDYTQPADLLTLAATTALPAFFRSMFHSWGSTVAKHRRDGVGYYVPDKTPVADFKDEFDSAPMFMLPKSLTSAEKASKRIEEIIREIEGE